ncbi:unnamed protein product, partial [Iphiclides podalirius]
MSSIEMNKTIIILDEQIQNIKANMKTEDSFSSHDIHHFSISYGLVAVVGLAAVVWVGRRYKQIRQQRANAMAKQECPPRGSPDSARVV